MSKEALLISYGEPKVSGSEYEFAFETYEEVAVNECFNATTKTNEVTLVCTSPTLTNIVKKIITGDAIATSYIQMYEQCPPGKRKGGPKIIIT